MKKFLYILFLVLISLSNYTFCQEKLIGLTSNPVLQKYSQSRNIKNGMKNRSPKAPLILPFIDDFSKPGVYPDTSKWIDRDVFINNSFPLFPVSYGVATFDALNDSGYLYSTASSFPFIADHLSSQYIDLHNLHPSDGVYLSFFVQPQGIGNDPEVDDSLVLEFLEIAKYDSIVDTTVTPPVTTYIGKWAKVWSMPGMPLDTFLLKNNNHYFQLVMIPVDSLKFFRSDFQFRFYNYASIASNNILSWRSNCDQWNIDYVYMNSGRTKNDTVFSDMAFVNTAPSFLKIYQSMTAKQYAPYKHLLTRDSVEMLISNLSRDTLPYSYQFDVRDTNGTVIFSKNAGNWNIFPFYNSGYQTYPPHRYPKLDHFIFPVAPGDTNKEYTITHSIARIGTSQEFIKDNDTIRFVQQFKNYLAYDDGTPEAGYGLFPAGGALAYQFTLSTPDTLTGLSMFFNRTLGDANVQNFFLAVWKDKSGKPGDYLYVNKNYSRPLMTEGENVFHTYSFDKETPIVLDNNNLTFYVGWIQTTDDNLNVGFDLNNNSQSYIFYNVDGTWQNTGFMGSLMIRPVLGSKQKKLSPSHHFSFGPNPTSGKCTILLPSDFSISDLTSSEISIFNIIGEKVANPVLISQEIDLSFLSNGLYIVKINSREKNLSFSDKLIIVK